ncbi:MAG: FkbM family methyltransferase [Bacteroidales bacterium]|nr:FkbM family methyltransferase [Bacteroidales bacterium]
MIVKEFLRKSLNALHIDLTKNLKYDRLTKQVISKVVKSGSICVDVGCHKGEILDLILQYAPNVGHFAFEPLPEFYDKLKLKYSKLNNIFPFALSDHGGETTFQFVKNAPAYSGILIRKYDIKNPEIQEIKVQVKTLDSIIPDTVKIDLIKIDVEGGELPVLKGAKKVILKNKPIIIFECGIGASEYYGTKPEDVYDFLVNKLSLNISLLDDWLKNKLPLKKDNFCEIFNKNTEYYFIAHP